MFVLFQDNSGIVLRNYVFESCEDALNFVDKTKRKFIKIIHQYFPNFEIIDYHSSNDFRFTLMRTEFHRRKIGTLIINDIEKQINIDVNEIFPLFLKTLEIRPVGYQILNANLEVIQILDEKFVNLEYNKILNTYYDLLEMQELYLVDFITKTSIDLSNEYCIIKSFLNHSSIKQEFKKMIRNDYYIEKMINQEIQFNTITNKTLATNIFKELLKQHLENYHKFISLQEQFDELKKLM